MVGMWIVLAAVVVLIVAIVVFAAIRRPRGDDLNSVRSYHSALGTLEHLADRNGPVVKPVSAPVGETRSTRPPVGDPPSDGATGAPRSYRRPDAYAGDAAPGLTAATPAPPAPPAAGGSPVVPPVPLRVDGQPPDPSVPLVFDDARPKDRARPESSADGVPANRTDRAQRNALHSMNHRRRRGSTASIVVAAVVIFAVLAYVGSRRSGTNHPSHAATHTTSTTTGTSNPSGTAHSTTTAPAKKKHTKPTPTTVPTQIVAVTSTSTRAVYPVTTAAYTLDLAASGPCWVDATTSATGATLWTGTLQAGGTQVIHASGSVTVEMGSPTLSIALNNVPVEFPTPIHTPFTAAFQPGAAASAATTTTTAPVGSTTTSPG
jgi:hypothetical protein